MANPLRRAWEQAAHLAEQTPASRNRYVDFLRAASIIVVIIGHWLVVASCPPTLLSNGVALVCKLRSKRSLGPPARGRAGARYAEIPHTSQPSFYGDSRPSCGL